jgi:soluble lytic murein transglycosylase
MALSLKTAAWTVLFLFAWALSAQGDIYRYIDSNGVLHFTNVPVSSGYQVYLKETSTEPTDVYELKTALRSQPPMTPSGASGTDRFDRYIFQASRKHDISFSLLKAVIKVESDFNPHAVSKKGAKGLMQIMPENMVALNINDPFNPRENIMGGSKYLKTLLTKFDGKLPLALAAYNAGPTAVDRYRRIPPYKETKNYVKKVMTLYHQMNKIGN